MSEFNVTDTSGIERRICAKRMTSEGRYLWFHDLTSGGWTAVGRIDRTQVSCVSFTVTRSDGTTQWIHQPIPSETESLTG